jgi:hypothetical protein
MRVNPINAVEWEAAKADAFKQAMNWAARGETLTYTFLYKRFWNTHQNVPARWLELFTHEVCDMLGIPGKQ